MSADAQGQADSDTRAGAFVGSSSVGRYWQARSVGFEVRDGRQGRLLGHVASASLDRAGGAEFVVVRRPHRRRPLEVPYECVDLVEPWQRVLVVSLPLRRRLRAPSVQPVWRAARRAGPVAAAGAVRAASLVGIAAWLYGVVVVTLLRVLLSVAVPVLTTATAAAARLGARFDRPGAKRRLAEYAVRLRQHLAKTTPAGRLG